MSITKCHLCLLQPSHCTINTHWHFIVSLPCHKRILLLKACTLPDAGCQHRWLRGQPTELSFGSCLRETLSLPSVDRHGTMWTCYRTPNMSQMGQRLPNQDTRRLKNWLIENEAGGFTLRCKESCRRSIFWAAGWAWWSSGNLQSWSSWRWCQAAK